MRSSTFDWEQINVPEIVESLTGLIFAPVILPLAAAVHQPTVQTAIKGGIALSERCKEALAETTEVIENLAAEVNAELINDKQAEFNSEMTRIYSQDAKSEIARDLINVISDVNTDVGRITNGVIDLRLLLPLGFSALAVRQLFIKGLQIDEIPWYVLAWYAFDSFMKLNTAKESND
ncbi:MAG: DUF5132 domain-containing protein [Fischerella sp.]|jgi:hypothetical protein|uniref:DUF5132 domain-containing protein n=1 Tax=Fischerella sp. TaxID=1191 RepID=UPI0017ABBC24|nr:DUF5132 domain-containing protein [Fischerella sp.]NWF60777.1 DUF5132 domain-containing protein [Fischerella sp.]